MGSKIEYEGRARELKILAQLDLVENEAPELHEFVRGSLGMLDEYGLCLDYVEPNTFRDQPHGYARYQLPGGTK